jgi:hypothetical protein
MGEGHEAADSPDAGEEKRRDVLSAKCSNMMLVDRYDEFVFAVATAERMRRPRACDKVVIRLDDGTGKEMEVETDVKWRGREQIEAKEA